MMDKSTLEAAAQQLATAELVCRGMKIIAENAKKELEQFPKKSAFEKKSVKLERQQLEDSCEVATGNFERASHEVVELTEKVCSIRAQVADLSSE